MSRRVFVLGVGGAHRGWDGTQNPWPAGFLPDHAGWWGQPVLSLPTSLGGKEPSQPGCSQVWTAHQKFSLASS